MIVATASVEEISNLDKITPVSITIGFGIERGIESEITKSSSIS